MGRTAQDYTKLVEAVLAPHRWLLCSDAAAAFTAFIPVFGEIGAPKPLLLAGTPGTGPLPDPEACEVVILGTSADTMLGGIRAYHKALRRLPAWALARIDAWDPHGVARVMQTFLDTEYDVARRRSWGARPESWLALEDKMIVDEIWDAAGIGRAPVEIVPAEPGALRAASHRLDSGAGVVWTADNRDGWHGGAEYSRFVQDPEDASEAIEFMTGHAHRVRVMPFLEGVPCAIQGLVLPAHVAVFRPVEMVVFRQPGEANLRYAACATSWDPPDEARQEMRRVARLAGDHLRSAYDFRGAFTVDGVLTAEGFRPTELNPRYGAGIGTLAAKSGMPLLGLSRMLIEREGGHLDGPEIERLTIEGSDAARVLGGRAFSDVRVEETTELRARWDGGTVEEAGEDDANATVVLGPATHGSMIQFRLDPDVVPIGRFAAPIVAQALALADRKWDLGIGELIPARPA